MGITVNNVEIHNVTLSKMFDLAYKEMADGHSKKTIGIDTPDSITSRAWQTLGSRKTEFKNGNLEARKTLLDALKSEFGVTEKKDLPPSVLKALKLSNFESTKRPLTARRIAAIQTAVEQAKTSRTENAGSVKQLSKTKTFGSRRIQYMTMTEEAEGIEANLAHVFDDNHKEATSFEGDLAWLADECVSRSQKMILGAKTVTQQSLFNESGVDARDEFRIKDASVALCKQQLATFFTTIDPKTKQPVFDEAGERMFCRIMHSGDNYPEFEIRGKKKGSAQFLYMPNQVKKSDGHPQAWLSRLSDGHYRLELTRTLTGFHEITEFKHDLTLKYDEKQNVDKNFYSYSVAYEFYADEAGKPVVHLCSAPKMEWRFAKNPIIGANYGGDPAYEEDKVFVE